MTSSRNTKQQPPNKATHNRTREDAKKTLCALSFCVYTEREKETTTHTTPQGHKNKQGRQEDKPRTTKAKPQKIGKEEENGYKRIKRKANTQQVI